MFASTCKTQRPPHTVQYGRASRHDDCFNLLQVLTLQGPLEKCYTGSVPELFGSYLHLEYPIVHNICSLFITCMHTCTHKINTLKLNQRTTIKMNQNKKGYKKAVYIFLACDFLFLTFPRLCVIQSPVLPN